MPRAKKGWPRGVQSALTVLVLHLLLLPRMIGQSLLLYGRFSGGTMKGCVNRSVAWPMSCTVLRPLLACHLHQHTKIAGQDDRRQAAVTVLSDRLIEPS